MHRTLAADRDTFFAIRHIEWRYPFISIHKLIMWLGLEETLYRTDYWPKSDAGRLAARMHHDTLYDFEEDGIFFEERFLHHLFIFLRFPYPSLLSKMDAFPELPKSIQDHMLEIHRRVLKKVHYLRGTPGRLYLSKEVTSHNKISGLIKLYPDARFIVLVRHSQEFLDSLLALMRNSTMAKTGIDPCEISGWRDAVLERMRNDCNLITRICKRELEPLRQFQIPFGYFTKNVKDSVCSIYETMNLNPSATYLQHLHSLDEKQCERQRGYGYDYHRSVGFDEFDEFVDEVEKRFQFAVSVGDEKGAH